MIKLIGELSYVSLPWVLISFFGVKILEKDFLLLCKKVFDHSPLKQACLSEESRNVYVRRCIYY